MARNSIIAQWWKWHRTLARVAAQDDEYGMREIWHKASAAVTILSCDPTMYRAAPVFCKLSDRAFELLQKKRNAVGGD